MIFVAGLSYRWETHNALQSQPPMIPRMDSYNSYTR